MTDRWASSGRSTSFDGVVLAGGASNRMGFDKALIEIDGLSLASRVGRALSDAGAMSVLGVGRSHGPETYIDRWVEDDWPGEGPLGGIITALRSTRCDVVAIVACDIPHVSGIEIANLVEHAAMADVVVTVVDGREQLLHGLWHRRCVDPLVGAFQSGVRSVREGIAELKVVRVEPIDARSVNDADTPQSLRSLLDGG